MESLIKSQKKKKSNLILLYLKTNANIIVVDWSKGAPMPWYLDAVDNTRVVGLKTAEFILANNLNPKNVHCIGK